jgi:iron uptake system EfeUOB component EfeO/EfeM
MSPAQFVAPINSYRRYAVAQLDGMLSQIRRLEQALAGGDRAGAEEAWRGAYDRYLHLGAVYLVGPVAALNDEIDGIADGLPGGVSNPRFAGLHRIEYGLWGGLAPQSLEPWAQRLEQAVRKLRARLGHVVITPLEYATRAHEILEDAQRDLLSGADVPWSGEGVLATEAGLEATEEILSTMHIYLFTEDGENERAVGPPAATELAALRAVLGSLAAAHGGRLPKNGQLTQHQAELLDGTLGGALEALAEIPGVLEAEPRPRVVPIPPRDARSDP